MRIPRGSEKVAHPLNSGRFLSIKSLSPHGLKAISPPPKVAFWEYGTYSIPIAAEGNATARLSLERQKRTFKHPSPVQAQKKYEEVMV